MLGVPGEPHESGSVTRDGAGPADVLLAPQRGSGVSWVQQPKPPLPERGPGRPHLRGSLLDLGLGFMMWNPMTFGLDHASLSGE